MPKAFKVARLLDDSQALCPEGFLQISRMLCFGPKKEGGKQDPCDFSNAGLSGMIWIDRPTPWVGSFADAIGNTAGVIDSFDGVMQPQHFDAFGCDINGTLAYTSAPKCAESKEEPPADLNDADGFNYAINPPGGQDAEPTDRLSAGRQQWRGHEGSQTDLAGWDQFDGASPVRNHKWAAHSRPSTGLVYMQARYYDPEVGRFTQWDPVPYGPEMAWGQNNRWTYCANDPVNFSDSSGQYLDWSFGGMLLLAAGIATMVAAAVWAWSVPGSLMTAMGAFMTGMAGIFAALAYMETDPCMAKTYTRMAKVCASLGAAMAFCGPFVNFAMMGKAIALSEVATRALLTGLAIGATAATW